MCMGSRGSGILTNFRDVSLRVLLRVGLLCGMCFLASVVAWGQETNGITSITGRVVDQQGGQYRTLPLYCSVAEAVRLQQTKTDESGSFTFPSIHLLHISWKYNDPASTVRTRMSRSQQGRHKRRCRLS